MKVGLVSPYDFSSPGGVTEHVRHLGHWLRRLGHEVRVFAPASRPESEEPGFYRIGRTFAIPVNDSVARITLSFHLARKVSDILEEERFDVLHFHEPLMPALPLTLLRLSRTANVGTFHAFARSNVGYYYGRPLLRPYLNHLHAGIAVSEPAERFLHQYFREFPLRVIPNGVDLGVFQPGLPPIRHLRDDRVNFLFVGRLEKRKGLIDLLRAYEHLRARFERARLIVVGDGPLRSQVESYANRRRLPEVVFAGYVPKEVLPRYYGSADIFCAPATGGESFGLVLLEAMACGLPVVATEVPGYLSLLEPGRDSLAVRPKAWAELGAALVVLARDADLRRRMGASGLAKARRYGWGEVAGRVIEVYQEARRAAAPGKEEPVVHGAASGLG
ncbi:MAG TPA: glycosyltransferase family 4 protein [Candidatus Acidoferrales bacterium]|nr:glycosyltransferase family 4 protein [Candidatus Acidoferrales bacterium]